MKVEKKAIDLNEKLIVDKLSYDYLLRRWKLKVSKKLLIIRPNVPGDNYTALFSYNAAEQVKTKAVAEGWTVTDLKANDTKRILNPPSSNIIPVTKTASPGAGTFFDLVYSAIVSACVK